MFEQKFKFNDKYQVNKRHWNFEHLAFVFAFQNCQRIPSFHSENFHYIFLTSRYFLKILVRSSRGENPLKLSILMSVENIASLKVIDQTFGRCRAPVGPVVGLECDLSWWWWCPCWPDDACGATSMPCTVTISISSLSTWKLSFYQF